MPAILAEIETLIQHIQHWQSNPEDYRPEKCLHCKHVGLHHHGHYLRKVDRENTAEHSLNPIEIPRFYCSQCRRTCSVLPECIPPYRSYLWSIQQLTLLLILQGHSFSHAARESLPSRWSIKRWYQRLCEQFQAHALHLRSLFSSLGYADDFNTFWCACLKRINLSKAMYLLHQSGVVIP